MSISSYPGGFRGGILYKEIPTFDLVAGKVLWVDSGTGGDGNPGTFNRPLATIDAAANKCTGNNGDRIYCFPGHSEALDSAGALTFDTAGITVVGAGHARDRSQITFETASAADIDITAASTRFVNMRFTANYADIAGGLDVGASAHGLQVLSCRFDEAGTNLNWVEAVNVADGADDAVFYDCDYIGNDALNDNWVQFAGTHENVEFVFNRCIHETAQMTAVGIIASATQQINMLLLDNFFHSETAAAAASFVVLANTTNNGWAIRNMISSVDTDAEDSDAVSAFDVTGLFCSGNMFSSGVADTYAIETFLTAEDLS